MRRLKIAAILVALIGTLMACEEWVELLPTQPVVTCAGKTLPTYPPSILCDTIMARPSLQVPPVVPMPRP